MGNRLSKIATRTGDDGTTGLGDGSRTAKDSLRIAAIGDVDELNSHIGVLLTETLPDGVRTALTAIQHDLFDLGGELCIPGYTMVTTAHVLRLDQWLADYNADLPRLAEFILPGACLPHRRAPCRAQHRRTRPRRDHWRGAAPIRQSTVGPAVRAGACAQSRRWRHGRPLETRRAQASVIAVRIKQNGPAR